MTTSQPSVRGRLPERILIIGILILAAAWLQATGLGADILGHAGDIEFLTIQHIELTVISGVLAVGTGLPLGILLSRRFMRRWAEGAMQVLNIGTTIPTLAVLALSMTFLGIGAAPAIFALWVASLLYIVRNTYSGLTSVPFHLLEAAYGVGLTSEQVLWRVELPNALFVIFAGIRTALAINVGTVPLAFLVGGGGLGELIFTGIDLNDTGTMLAGAIPTALLAVAVDALMGFAAYALIPRGVNPLR